MSAQTSTAALVFADRFLDTCLGYAQGPAQVEGSQASTDVNSGGRPLSSPTEVVAVQDTSSPGGSSPEADCYRTLQRRIMEHTARPAQGTQGMLGHDAIIWGLSRARMNYNRRT